MTDLQKELQKEDEAADAKPQLLLDVDVEEEKKEETTTAGETAQIEEEKE